MTRQTLFPVLLALFVLPAASAWSWAGVYFSTELEMAEQSDTVLDVKVVSVDRKTDTAVVRVGQVVHGKVEAQELTVTPVVPPSGSILIVNFKAGEEALVFGTLRRDGRFGVACDGHGKVPLTDDTRDEEIAAAKRLLQIAAIKDAHEKNLALLGETRSPNDRIRAEALNYIAMMMPRGNQAERYKPQLIDLLNDKNAEVQRAALEAIRFVKAPEVLPRIIELSRSAEGGVAGAASPALGQYDTPESVAALIALTQDVDPDMRARACIDLDNSRRPEAKRALVALLDDDDPKVRAIAPRGLVGWLRRGEANDVLPRLVEMLDDPSDAVRTRAAEALGEVDAHEVVEPLLDVLAKGGQTDETYRQIFSSLYRHYARGPEKTRRLIDDQIDLVVMRLREDAEPDVTATAEQAVRLLGMCPRPEAAAALRWAAGSYPAEYIRDAARTALMRRN